VVVDTYNSSFLGEEIGGARLYTCKKHKTQPKKNKKSKRSRGCGSVVKGLPRKHKTFEFKTQYYQWGLI
jgi:hypothetical protein